MSRKAILRLIAVGSALWAGAAAAADSQIKVIYPPKLDVQIRETPQVFYAPPAPTVVKQTVNVATIVVAQPFYARPRWLQWDPRYSWPNGSLLSGSFYYSGVRYPF
jgi:hypothetical protein